MENPIENKPIIPEEKKKEMSALEYDIKNKGENSYYYAHKGRFEEKDKDPNAKTISGPGIITGGDPVLLQTEKRTIEKIKEPKTISKYIFYDDDKFAVVKINLPDDALDINEDNLEYDIITDRMRYIEFLYNNAPHSTLSIQYLSHFFHL